MAGPSSAAGQGHGQTGAGYLAGLLHRAGARLDALVLRLRRQFRIRLHRGMLRGPGQEYLLHRDGPVIRPADELAPLGAG